MIGAVLGDIAGSKWEFDTAKRYYKPDMKLWEKDSFYTDDTVLLCATRFALRYHMSYAEAYKMFFDSYPDFTYGNSFKVWARSQEQKPYNSFGNGSAMRVGFIGEYFDNRERVIEEAIKSAECTHNHPEGIKGAVATALCTYYSKKGKDKEFLKECIKSEFKYDLFDSMEEMHEATKDDFCEETCQKTMPVALSAFLLSEDYEDCIRKVLSTECDTDTVACIAGGIAENFYGKTVPMAEMKILYYVEEKMLREMILNRNLP